MIVLQLWQCGALEGCFLCWGCWVDGSHGFDQHWGLTKEIRKICSWIYIKELIMIPDTLWQPEKQTSCNFNRSIPICVPETTAAFLATNKLLIQIALVATNKWVSIPKNYGIIKLACPEKDRSHDHISLIISFFLNPHILLCFTILCFF